MKAKTDDKVDKFHQHLDKCKRCARAPFNLCLVGLMLLTAATIREQAEGHKKGTCDELNEMRVLHRLGS